VSLNWTSFSLVKKLLPASYVRFYQLFLNSSEYDDIKQAAKLCRQFLPDGGLVALQIHAVITVYWERQKTIYLEET
jgi:hypothetical protein